MILNTVTKEEEKQNEIPSPTTTTPPTTTPTTTPPLLPLTKPADPEQMKDEKEGEETMKRVTQEKEEKIKTQKKANEAANKLSAIEKKVEEKAATETMKGCEQEMKRLGEQDGNENDDSGIKNGKTAEEEDEDEECNAADDVAVPGEYSSEGAAREWSTVVEIYIPLPSIKPVSLSLSRSPLSKTPKQSLF